MHNTEGSVKSIPEKFGDLFKDETRAFLFLATIMDDGTPQVTPVWFNHDSEHILLNSAKGRTKDVNMRARPDVACAIMDPGNPYRYIQLRGTVVEITEQGAADHIRDLNYKYHGNRDYPIGNDTRVTYKMRVDKVSTMG